MTLDPMPNYKLKINLFGEAWKLKQISISEEQKTQWQTITKRMKLPLLQAIVDPFFYYYLKDSAIQTIEDLVIITEVELLNNSKNQIEIWFKNKKVQKLTINDLNEELLLFPLYNTIRSKKPTANEKGIYIEQKEIGLIASYELNIGHFNIDDLLFHISKEFDCENLQKITYQMQNFILKKTDTLMTYQNCFEVL